MRNAHIEGRTVRRIAMGCLVLAAAAAACGPGVERRGDVIEDGVPHESARLSLRFRHPADFVVGRFAEEETPPGPSGRVYESPFRDAVVLVEPAQLGDLPLEAIPLGDIPTISIDRVTNPVILSMVEGAPEMTIEGRRTFKFPGYPGPYGDQAHFYLVEIEPREYVEFLAHRFYWHAETEAGLPETGYDAVIEKVIATLEPLAP